MYGQRETVSSSSSSSFFAYCTLLLNNLESSSEPCVSSSSTSRKQVIESHWAIIPERTVGRSWPAHNENNNVRKRKIRKKYKKQVSTAQDESYFDCPSNCLCFGLPYKDDCVDFSIGILRNSISNDQRNSVVTAWQSYINLLRYFHFIIHR